MQTRRFRFPSGADIDVTALGFGGAPLGNLYAAIPEEIAQATLRAAWETGMRLFDTAPLYGLGLSEERFGRFLSAMPREDFTLSTKVGRVLRDVPPSEATPDKFIDVPSRAFDYDYSYDGVMRSFEQSLKRMGLERVDILLCHDVDTYTHGSAEAANARIREFLAGGYKALVELREGGAVKAIGAGVNEWEICERLAREGDFDVFLLAGRYTLLEQEALTSFLPLTEERGIGIILGGPYNSGILASGPRPGAFYNYAPAPEPILERVRRIERVCEAHGVRLVEAALQFPLAHPSVISVIPGGRTPDEVRANAATLTADIPVALWAELKREGLIHADAPVPGVSGNGA